jgi:hypothetical protein
MQQLHNTSATHNSCCCHLEKWHMICLRLLLAANHSAAAVHMLDHTTVSAAKSHLKDL